MPRTFYKFKLLLDENMPPRQRFPRLNSRFDVKHIRDDLKKTVLKDPAIYDLARTRNRLIITFNGDDFKHMVGQSTQTGVINLSPNLRNDQIDTKLTALLIKKVRVRYLANLPIWVAPHLTVVTLPAPSLVVEAAWADGPGA